ncbi:MAG: hypothetical protein KF691_13050 [Phycisphaeraceae bacterium]|nr:hypothetical protein [Phycisphaeraceae bacterium]
MDVSPQIAVCVLLLVPGLIGHSLFCALTYTAAPSWSARTVIAIILSAFSYISISLLRCWPALDWLPDPSTLLGLADKTTSAIFAPAQLMCVVIASGLALIFATLLVLAHNGRLVHRIAALVGMTTKNGFASEWDATLITRARDKWLMLLLNDGTAFTGWLKSHDVASEERALVLEKIREYDREGTSFLWPDDELLFLNDLSNVRAMRIIPVKEFSNEQVSAPTARVQCREEISEQQSQSAPKTGPAGFADQAGEIANELIRSRASESLKE